MAILTEVWKEVTMNKDQVGFAATIKRRSGRHITDHNVDLAQPAELYKQSDTLVAVINGQPRQLNVEIPIGPTNDVLYVS